MYEEPNVRVVAISFNEEVDIEGFLNNLHDKVDEIVIVDDGSTDKTREICESFGEKSNFSKTQKRKKGEYYADHVRNKGINKSKSDWILHMGIDERVSKELFDEIKIAINQNKYDVFKFRRLNYFLHRPMKGGGWADWNLVHLAKREV